MSENRNIEVAGIAQVADQWKLTSLADRTGWLASYCDESLFGDHPHSEKTGLEIFGDRNTDPIDSQSESLLEYHRPLIEDGTLAYGVFHEPARVIIDRALDHLVCRLNPDGQAQ